MSVEISNSHIFFAYHLRSAFLALESNLQNSFTEVDLEPEHFYVLRYDWKKENVPLKDLEAHSMLSRNQVVQAVNELIQKGIIIACDGSGYLLSSSGEALREQLLSIYRNKIATATNGISEKTIQTVLSGLLTFQSNLPSS